jgi:polyisoprenoid-binding protein YceI
MIAATMFCRRATRPHCGTGIPDRRDFMKRILLAGAVIGLMTGTAFAQGTPALAPAGAYAADKPHTSLTWQILHNNLSWYTARFTDVDVQLTFDPTDVTKSKVMATIQTKSVETDYARTRPATSTADFNDEVATGDRWLNGNKFPQITFVSTAITKTGDTTGKMTGNLTFLGVTKPVTLDVTYIGAKPDPRTQKQKVGFQAKGTFKRSDFGMTGGPVGDEVRIEVNSEMLQK